MNEFYYVRHGETTWNKKELVCGETDVDLTELGREQARLAGEEILNKGIKADEILCSPLKRASDTAYIISEITGIPVRVEPRLKEQSFGKYEGTMRYSDEFMKSKQQFACNYDGGESMLKLAQRVYNLLDEIKSDNEKTYILVAHNGIARMVNSYFNDMTNEEYSKFGVPNASVIRYEFE